MDLPGSCEHLQSCAGPGATRNAGRCRGRAGLGVHCGGSLPVRSAYSTDGRCGSTTGVCNSVRQPTMHGPCTPSFHAAHRAALGAGAGGRGLVVVRPCSSQAACLFAVFLVDGKTHNFFRLETLAFELCGSCHGTCSESWPAFNAQLPCPAGTRPTSNHQRQLVNAQPLQSHPNISSAPV